MTYTLMDGVERNKKHPTTFEIPSSAEKQTLKVGEYVKLGFVIDHPDHGVCGERMWVKITKYKAGKGEGTLDNNPMAVELSHGAVVKFAAKNILDIIKGH